MNQAQAYINEHSKEAVQKELDQALRTYFAGQHEQLEGYFVLELADKRPDSSIVIQTYKNFPDGSTILSTNYLRCKDFFTTKSEAEQQEYYAELREETGKFNTEEQCSKCKTGRSS